MYFAGKLVYKIIRASNQLAVSVLRMLGVQYGLIQIVSINNDT